MNKVYDFIFKYQRYILGAAISLALFAVSFRFNNRSVDLVWKNRPFTAVTIIMSSLILFLLYIQIDNYRVKKLIKQIEEKSSDIHNNKNELLGDLTGRQRQVYDLITQGKSNKEITSELFIEQSTLKTHINQIYKKLQVGNRKELKKLFNNND